MSVDEINRTTNLFIDEAQLIEVCFIGFDRILPIEEKKRAIEKVGIKRQRPLIKSFPGGISVISEVVEHHVVYLQDLEERDEDGEFQAKGSKA